MGGYPLMRCQRWWVCYIKETPFTTRSHNPQCCDIKTARRRRKRYHTLSHEKKKERKNVFHHYLDCIFCNVCRKMAGRHSKRVRHEEPDVDTNDHECFVCHLKSQTCDRRVQLPCCKQYAHRRCQLRWEENHIVSRPLDRMQWRNTCVSSE